MDKKRYLIFGGGAHALRYATEYIAQEKLTRNT